MYVTITMRSETYARKAMRILSQNRIACSIVRLDGELAKKGCSYGVKIDGRARAVSIKLLSDNNIPYSDVRMI